MRTTVDIDVELLDDVMRETGARSRKECIEAALRALREKQAQQDLGRMFGIAKGKAEAPSRRRF